MSVTYSNLQNPFVYVSLNKGLRVPSVHKGKYSKEADRFDPQQ